MDILDKLEGPAVGAAIRLIDSHFGNDGPRPEAQIPASPDDTDVVMLLDTLKAAGRNIKMLRKKLEAQREELEAQREDFEEKIETLSAKLRKF